MVRFGLRPAHDLLERPRPAGMARAVEMDRRVASLERKVIGWMFPERAEQLTPIIPHHEEILFNLRCRERLRHQLRCSVALGRHLSLPHPRNTTPDMLPRPLALLRALLWPIRVLRKHGREEDRHPRPAVSAQLEHATERE